MERCEKCGKETYDIITSVYGEKRCEDCWDDYLMTDKGKVEYFVGLCLDELDIKDYDADFLGWLGVCWKKYRDELDKTLAEVKLIENKAVSIGLL